MLSWFRARSESRRKARDLYGAIVAQARQEAFYSDIGVPDTPAGRYEMIVVHLFVVLERLKSQPAAYAKLGQPLVEAFVTDMDDSLREMGTGDMGVPKKVRRAAGGLYERSKVYGEAVATGDRNALSRTLARYVFGIDEADWHSDRLAGYLGQAMGSSTAGNFVRFPTVTAYGKDAG